MKNFVVIAHDRLKEDVAKFLAEKEDWLKIRNARIIATGRTAEFLEKKSVSNIEHLSQGKYGGYNEITKMVLNGDIDIVIFFRDHMVKEPHHADIQLLLDTCVGNNIPLATNVASAELLMLGLIKKEATDRLSKRSTED